MFRLDADKLNELALKHRDEYAKEHSTLFQARPGEDIKENKLSGMTAKTCLKKLVPPIFFDLRDALKKQ